MRSAIIAATFALAIFAAPVPEPNPIYKSGGTGCIKVVAGVCVRTGKREAGPSTGFGIEAKFPATTVRHQRDLEDEIEEAEVYTTRSVREHKRSPILTRPKNSRNTVDEEDAEVDFEPRTIRGGSSNKRSADPEPINRIHGGSGPTRWSTREAEPFSRAGAGKRTAEPEPFGRAGAGKRTAEPEPESFSRAGAGKRDAEAKAEPINRIHG